MKRKMLTTLCLVVLMFAVFKLNINGKPLNAYEALKETERAGQLLDLSDPWKDIQKINYNLKSITNMMTAEGGETYTVYVIETVQEGVTYIAYVNNITNQEQQGVREETRTKVGSIQSVWDIIDFISNLWYYIWWTACYIGELTIDVFICLVGTLYKTFRLIVNLLNV